MRQPRALRVGITAVFTTLGLVAGLTLVTAPYAAADETIVVHGPGGFPDGSTQGTVQQPCDDVAAALFVHPQTVRYRMGQLRELYGDRLEDPDTVRDLTLALA